MKNNNKNDKKDSSELKWFITIFITAFILSIIFSFISTTAITGLSTKPASSVTVTITGPEKSNITLDQNPYSFDGGKTWQSSNSKEFVQNTNDISIKVKGSDGKIYVHPQFDITNIQ